MKISSLAGVAVIAFAINGCAAATDTSSENPSVGSTTQAVVGTPGNGDPQSLTPVAGTPLFSAYFPSTKELDVQDCTVFHPGMLTSAPSDHPCSALYPDRHIKLVNALAMNAFGRIVGDTPAVEDGPGGGCVHMIVDDAVSGGSLKVLVIGKNLDGSGAHREQVYFFSVSTT